MVGLVGLGTGSLACHGAGGALRPGTRLALLSLGWHSGIGGALRLEPRWGPAASESANVVVGGALLLEPGRGHQVSDWRKLARGPAALESR